MNFIRLGKPTSEKCSTLKKYTTDSKDLFFALIIPLLVELPRCYWVTTTIILRLGYIPTLSPCTGPFSPVRTTACEAAQEVGKAV